MAQAPKELMTAGSEEVVIHGRFQVNGLSDPDAIYSSHEAVSDVSLASTGVFDIILAEEYRYPDHICTLAQVEADPTITAQPVSYTQATGAVRIQTLAQDGTPAVANPTDDKWVHFKIVMVRRSELAKSKSI